MFTLYILASYEAVFTNLDAVVVGVGDDDVVLRVDCHSRRLRELPFEHAELAELKATWTQLITFSSLLLMFV